MILRGVTVLLWVCHACEGGLVNSLFILNFVSISCIGEREREREREKRERESERNYIITKC